MSQRDESRLTEREWDRRLGTLIAEFRRTLRWRQAEAARSMDMDEQRLGRLERGEISFRLEDLGRCAETYGVVIQVSAEGIALLPAQTAKEPR